MPDDRQAQPTKLKGNLGLSEFGAWMLDVGLVLPLFDKTVGEIGWEVQCWSASQMVNWIWMFFVSAVRWTVSIAASIMGIN